MGKGAARKRREDTKVRKQQMASAASTLPPASAESDKSSSQLKKRGRPRKYPPEALPPRTQLPCRTSHSTKIPPSTSSNVSSDLSEPEDKLPIETITSNIQQPSAGSTDFEISSADGDNFLEESDSSPDVEDVVDLDDDNNDSDKSILVIAKKSGHPGKAVKKPPNTRRKVTKTTTTDGM
ncbi:hypothetical protein APHAL10511_008235 [Amanita phalloides]|nr:hypothetical protein APHAL10511_008235 [Amanita phalloides]